jgi:photosystem II stability/assembly factor-like uncharacterized protein
MKKLQIWILSVLFLAGACTYNEKTDNETPNNYKEKDIKGANEIFRLIRTDGDGNIRLPESAHYYRELQALQKNAARKQNENVDWIERGPANVAGRTRTIEVDFSDVGNDTWVVGTAGGGIWKTRNAGGEWRKVSPDLPNLSIVTIAQSESNPDVFYAGSGEGALGGNFINGYGVFKSIDKGETWTLLESTAPFNTQDFQNVNRIVVHPDDENIVLAATSNGVNGQAFRSAVMKSIDGGQTWDKIYEPVSRAQQIRFDPRSPDTIYVSLILRGIAKSTDGGNNWELTSLLSTAESFGVERTEFAISPSNPNRLYASVSYVNRSGSGLFMSEDMGENWIQVQDPNNVVEDYLQQGEYDNCIVVSPDDEFKVFWGGVNLWRTAINPGDIISSDDRDFLTVTEENTDGFWDYVSFNNGTHYQNQLAINDPANTPNIEIRFGPGLSQKAHRFTVPSGSTSGVPSEDYAYEDYVDVPFEVWNTDDDMQLMISFRDQERDGAFNLNERSDDQLEANNREYLYIHSIQYDPNNPSSDITVNGGIDISQYIFMWPTLPEDGVWDPDNLPEASINILFGQVSFNTASISQLEGEIHVDHHYLETIDNPVGFRLISVNDGGVGYSDDEGVTFTEVENRLNSTQFYNVVKAPGAKLYIGGTQDNDVLLSVNVDPDDRASYVETYDGAFADGFECAWNYFNPNKILTSNQRNVIVRSNDGGATWERTDDDIDDSGFNNINAPFYTKIGYSINTDNLVFVVSQTGIFRSVDFGKSWEKIPMFQEDGWGGFLDIEVSDADPNIVWAGGGMSDTRNLFVSTDGGVNFEKVNNYELLPDIGNITTIVPDPNDPNGAYVTFSQIEGPKILKTEDLGQTWIELSGFGTDTVSSNGYPDIATFCVLPFPDGQTIWAGTELGLVQSTDAGQTWEMANNGIPNVLIWDLKAIDGEVIAATYGRGVWTVNMELVYPNQNRIITSTGTAISLEQGIDVFPNPVTDQTLNVFLNIEENTLNTTKLELYDMHGRLVDHASNLKRGKNKISINLDRGAYVLKVSNELEEFFKKIIIR